MALYSFNASLISRGKGQSIVAADAYICGENYGINMRGKSTTAPIGTMWFIRNFSSQLGLQMILGTARHSWMH